MNYFTPLLKTDKSPLLDKLKYMYLLVKVTDLVAYALPFRGKKCKAFQSRLRDCIESSMSKKM